MDKETTKILQEISEMARTPGWQYLQKDFQFKIDQLQDDINKVGGNEMKYSENDIKKIELNMLKELVLYPERFVEMIKPQSIVEQMDPFLDK